MSGKRVRVNEAALKLAAEVVAVLCAWPYFNECGEEKVSEEAAGLGLVEWPGDDDPDPRCKLTSAGRRLLRKVGVAEPRP